MHRYENNRELYLYLTHTPILQHHIRLQSRANASFHLTEKIVGSPTSAAMYSCSVATKSASAMMFAQDPSSRFNRGHESHLEASLMNSRDQTVHGPMEAFVGSLIHWEFPSIAPEELEIKSVSRSTRQSPQFLGSFF